MKMMNIEDVNKMIEKRKMDVVLDELEKQKKRIERLEDEVSELKYKIKERESV